MFRLVAITCILFNVCLTASKDHLHLLSDEFIERINSKQSTWTAGRNFHKRTPLKYIHRLMGTYPDDHLANLPERNYTSIERKFPSNFDARNVWPHCPSLNDIRDQGACGSCWAVAAVSAMTDRLCIHSNGTKNFYFSAQDVLSCCVYKRGGCVDKCGGCVGGILRKAWEHYKHNGIVSGAGYNSSQGCKPYEIPPCEHGTISEGEDCDPEVKTPQCLQVCNQKYKVKYNKDKHRGKVVYKVEKERIIEEIFYFGPVTSFFNVYEDFLLYTDGIYKHTGGKYVGMHSVKLIGWGKERGTKFWLVANSWGTGWGSNGFFKIIRGDDRRGCGIENHVVAGK